MSWMSSLTSYLSSKKTYEENYQNAKNLEDPLEARIKIAHDALYKFKGDYPTVQTWRNRYSALLLKKKEREAAALAKEQAYESGKAADTEGIAQQGSIAAIKEGFSSLGYTTTLLSGALDAERKKARTTNRKTLLGIGA